MPENQNSELDTTELIGLVEGTVKELKDYIRSHDFSDEQLEQILNAESTSKDRKTAKKFLRNRIDGKTVEQKNSGSNEQRDELKTEETSLSREALLQMLGGTVEDVKEYVKENNPSDEELQNLLHAEKMVKDRKTVVKFLKSYTKKKELEEDFHKAETDLKELKQDLETIEENVLEEDVELELDQIPEPEDTFDEEETEGSESEEKEESEEDSEADEEESGTDDEDEKDNSEDEAEEDEEADSEEDAENEGESEEDDEESLSEMEKKKEILEDLEMDLSEEELEQISIEELKQLKGEKEKREKLIEQLSAKFDREQLEQVTTKDLEKLSDEIGGVDEISKQEAQRQEEEAKKQKKKDEEEMRKEAQEDLEMMMGAVKNEGGDDEDSEPGAVDQIKQLPDKFKDILNRGGDEDEEEESTGFDESKTIEVLESYSEAEDREATVKTAQVMKGYLEYALGIEREMTYAELADEMESQEVDGENIETLIEFYRSMKISVYTGDVETDNIDEVIEASKAVVKELS